MTCPICSVENDKLEMIQNTKTKNYFCDLSCSHTICFECILKILKTKINDEENALICPLCRDKVSTYKKPQSNINYKIKTVKKNYKNYFYDLIVREFVELIWSYKILLTHMNIYLAFNSAFNETESLRTETQNLLNEKRSMERNLYEYTNYVNKDLLLELTKPLNMKDCLFLFDIFDFIADISVPHSYIKIIIDQCFYKNRGKSIDKIKRAIFSVLQNSIINNFLRNDIIDYISSNYRTVVRIQSTVGDIVIPSPRAGSRRQRE